MCFGIKRQIVSTGRNIRENEAYISDRQLVRSENRKKVSVVEAHTDGEQLRGNTLELAQTLGDSVGCSRKVSSMAVPVKIQAIHMTPWITKSSNGGNPYRYGAPSVDRS
jgi:hypothetical protein